jgi:hypothetical protein
VDDKHHEHGKFEIPEDNQMNMPYRQLDIKVRKWRQCQSETKIWRPSTWNESYEADVIQRYESE